MTSLPVTAVSNRHWSLIGYSSLQHCACNNKHCQGEVGRSLCFLLVLVQFDSRDVFLLVLAQFDSRDVFYWFLHSLTVMMFFTGSCTVWWSWCFLLVLLQFAKLAVQKKPYNFTQVKELMGQLYILFFKFSNLLDTISTHTTFEQTSFRRIHNIVCRKCTWMYEIVSIETSTHPACAPLTSCRKSNFRICHRC